MGNSTLLAVNAQSQLLPSHLPKIPAKNVFQHTVSIVMHRQELSAPNVKRGMVFHQQGYAKIAVYYFQTV